MTGDRVTCGSLCHATVSVISTGDNRRDDRSQNRLTFRPPETTLQSREWPDALCFDGDGESRIRGPGRAVDGNHDGSGCEAGRSAKEMDAAANGRWSSRPSGNI